MARKATKPKPETEPEVSAGAHGRITKSEAARRAIAAGYDKPQEAVAYILGQFGIEMGAQHFSSIKTGMKKNTPPTKSTTWQSRKDAPSIESYFTPPPGPESTEEAGLLRAMEAMKPLVAAFGADKVKRIADLLG